MITSDTGVSVGIILSLMSMVITLIVALTLFSRWQGQTETKIDHLTVTLLKSFESMGKDINELFDMVRDTDRRVNELGTRLTIVETQHNTNHRTRKKAVDTGE